MHAIVPFRVKPKLEDPVVRTLFIAFSQMPRHSELQLSQVLASNQSYMNTSDHLRDEQLVIDNRFFRL